MKFLRVPELGDPSSFPQSASEISIRLLCCRYWWLTNWESQNMAFPYWRIYWNSNEGGSICYQDQKTYLGPSKIVIISPNTPFSSAIGKNQMPKTGYCLEGGPIDNSFTERAFSLREIVCHLFIHFNLSTPFTAVSPGVFSFEVTEEITSDLNALTNILRNEVGITSERDKLLIYKIILYAVSKIEDDHWKQTTNHPKIIRSLQLIEENLADEITNDMLAQELGMATNSFARLFKAETGFSPQQFVRQKRVQQASIFLHHTTRKLDEIARLSGFCDRFHLTKTFRETTGYTPSQYRKNFYLKKE